MHTVIIKITLLAFKSALLSRVLRVRVSYVTTRLDCRGHEAVCNPMIIYGCKYL